ncbi:beta-glucosidase BglX [Aquimarina sp. ERC-38]|uniref:beta-glucosidase BglX n=1 Tax=Aquimarina sp. ERC-38 TaxID=2949996 RepID=UPI00224616E0|nr:beta-glucosidase BglX [Aquimarina sp. ERC-38]UZO81490.1 beta-glucosidase BglX [Aquimarina sp. ERC-38]
MTYYKLLFLIFFSFLTGFSQKSQQAILIEQRVDSLLSQMTVSEKVGQLVLYSGSWDVTGPPSDLGNQKKLDNIKKGKVGAMLNVTSVAGAKKLQKAVLDHSRLKIPLLFGYDLIHGFKTIFPIPLAETASWDLEAIQNSAGITAREATASGINWAFGPMVDISRDARWGRVMEGAGEDPFLGSKVAVARVQGFQGKDLSDPHTLAACVKHFAAYGFAEAGRDYNTVSIGAYELFNTVLPPFKAAVDAGVASVMSAFNELDGIPTSAHKELLTGILKEKWNWDGFIVSDWGSIVELILHGYAKDQKEAAYRAINAGNDMDMEGRVYEKHLETLITENKVAIQLLDDAVKRILRVKFKLGLFDDPYRYLNEKREQSEIYTQENLEAAEDMALKSIVLLQNKNNILPISKKVTSIAVIGPLAADKDTPLGNWRGKAEKESAISLLEGIQEILPKSTKISYAKGVHLGLGERSFTNELTLNRTDDNGIEEAVALAKNAEIVVLVIGEEAFQSGEGRSQVSIELTNPQKKLFEAVQKVNKNLVVVLMNGRPLAIPDVAEKAPAILEAWHLGSRSGNAIARILFGAYNPSGKLPVSFPRHIGQVPLYYNTKSTGRPANAQGMVFWSHYTDERNAPLFPFGHGLCYTSFTYSNFKISKETFSKKEKITASVKLTNTGKVAGKEVVQLYIQDLFGSLTRPIKELKGFELVTLNPGESKIVSFIIDEKLLQFYTANKKWEAEPGDFKVYIGGSSYTDLVQKFRLTDL